MRGPRGVLGRSVVFCQVPLLLGLGSGRVKLGGREGAAEAEADDDAILIVPITVPPVMVLARRGAGGVELLEVAVGLLLLLVESEGEEEDGELVGPWGRAQTVGRRRREGEDGWSAMKYAADRASSAMAIEVLVLEAVEPRLAAARAAVVVTMFAFLDVCSLDVCMISRSHPLDRGAAGSRQQAAGAKS